ncbi:MAG: glycoside hydrolase family 5 protein [Prevotella sp.]|nr:glycoside hydrolase family 5 protein [Prevotella sp.]
MKKHVNLFVLFSLFTLLPLTASAQSRLQVVGSQLCDESGSPVTLRGISLGWHNLWPRFYNKGAVKWLAKEWHADVIRAAVGASSVDDNYLENPEFALQCVTPVIEAAIKNKVYVIIDWHSHEMHTAQAKSFFSQMAKKYGKHPNIIYELYNEPVNDSWQDLKQYATEIITEIRRYDPDNLILMGCPHWDQDIDLVAASPLEGVSNVMYTVHFYAATHKDYLRDKMRKAVEGGLPVFVSECAGMEASGDGPLDAAEWQKWVDTMEQLRISYVCWSLSDKNETCSMLLPRAKSCGDWTDDLIKPWGKMARAAINKKP